MTDEVWTTTAELAGDYEVSSMGRVRSYLGTGGQRGRRRATPKVLKPSLNARGYYCVNIRFDGKRRPVELQYLVCTAFHGPRPSRGHSAAHGDGDTSNNVASNLRWATWSEQAEDRRRHGTMPIGESNRRAVLTAQQVCEIRTLGGPINKTRLARDLGVSRSTIHRALSNRSWKHV